MAEPWSNTDRRRIEAAIDEIFNTHAERSHAALESMLRRHGASDDEIAEMRVCHQHEIDKERAAAMAKVAAEFDDGGRK